MRGAADTADVILTGVPLKIKVNSISIVIIVCFTINQRLSDMDLDLAYVMVSIMNIRPVLKTNHVNIFLRNNRT